MTHAVAGGPDKQSCRHVLANLTGSVVGGLSGGAAVKFIHDHMRRMGYSKGAVGAASASAFVSACACGLVTANFSYNLFATGGNAQKALEKTKSDIKQFLACVVGVSAGAVVGGFIGAVTAAEISHDLMLRDLFLLGSYWVVRWLVP